MEDNEKFKSEHTNGPGLRANGGSLDSRTHRARTRHWTKERTIRQKIFSHMLLVFVLDCVCKLGVACWRPPEHSVRSSVHSLVRPLQLQMGEDCFQDKITVWPAFRRWCQSNNDDDDDDDDERMRISRSTASSGLQSHANLCNCGSTCREGAALPVRMRVSSFERELEKLEKETATRQRIRLWINGSRSLGAECVRDCWAHVSA